jgi:hypothetical protein
MPREDYAVHSIEEPVSQPAIIHARSSEPSPDSSAVVSEDDGRGRSSSRLSRPKLGSRKSSGTMIVSRDAPTTVVDSDFEDDDVRAMSPRRNSEEVDKLGEDARRDLIEQAQILQTSLQAIVDRVETVKSEHEKLEGGNKFLQSYVIIPALLPHIYTNLSPGTLASSCKHPESHPLRHPKRARVALESKGSLFESLLFGICVIMLQYAATSMVEHRLPTQPCICFMALEAGSTANGRGEYMAFYHSLCQQVSDVLV